MTELASICERWAMKLEPSTDGEPWFLDWVMRSPKQAGIHLTAGFHAYRSISRLDIESAHECFGGMGAQSMMIHDIFPGLRDHSVGEFSWQAFQHLERVTEGWASVSLADAYDPELNLANTDLIGLDFGDLTVWKTRKGEPHRKLLNKAFGAQPKAVVLTDIACRYLHLHRERYESLLGAGTCGSYDSYLKALCNRLEALYGYTLVAGFSHRWSTVMSFAPSGVFPRGTIIPTPEKPVGLELL
jgi:hypothetical protein